jgi:hypothetical protein
LILGVVAQAAPAPDGEEGDRSAARLEFMKASVAAYEIHGADDPKVEYRLRPEPVLRYTNAVGRSRDGTVFLWVDDLGRPEVAAQASLNRRGLWVHELSSLANGPLTARSAGQPDWSPARAGVEMKPIPGAPRPPETAEQRMRQMRDLTREFAVQDDFQRESWQELRLLSKPFARYGKPASAVLDGALFCYVLTTDPEAYLMLEARPGKDGPEWQYGFAPSTAYPLRASWKETTVWEHNLDSPETGLTNTLHQRNIAVADPALIPISP